jgi:pimeloyl-ACP methyl ester carboxylesterase
LFLFDDHCYVCVILRIPGASQSQSVHTEFQLFGLLHWKSEMPFATVNSHALHYTDIAPSENKPSPITLIFVHGLGSTQNYYFPIFPYLASYRCIIFDNYGAGRSKYTTGTETSIPSIAKDVLGLLDHLKVDKAVVIGYSMGGMVPTYLASTSPDRVVAGICIGPVHPSEAVANVFKQRIPTVQKGKPSRTPLLISHVPFCSLLKRGNRSNGQFDTECGHGPECYSNTERVHSRDADGPGSGRVLCKLQGYRDCNAARVCKGQVSYPHYCRGSG